MRLKRVTRPVASPANRFTLSLHSTVQHNSPSKQGHTHELVIRNRARIPTRTRLDRRIRHGGNRAARFRHRPSERFHRSEPREADSAAAGGGEEARLVGMSPRAGTGRPGLRSGETRVDERNPRPRKMRANRIRLSGAGYRECGNPGALRHGRAESPLSRAAAEQRNLFLLFDDGTARRRRSEGVQLRGRSERRRVGDQRREVVLVERPLCVVSDRDGGDRRRRARVSAHVDVHRAVGYQGHRNRS